MNAVRTNSRLKTPQEGKEFPEVRRENKLYFPKALLPRKFSRTYTTVSCRVSPGSRGRKLSSRVAFEQLRYQKYWAISMAPGSTGEARSHCLNNESTRFAPVIAMRDGRAIRGAETFVRRSSRPKNFEKVQLAAPSR